MGEPLFRQHEWLRRWSCLIRRGEMGRAEQKTCINSLKTVLLAVGSSGQQPNSAFGAGSLLRPTVFVSSRTMPTHRLVIVRHGESTWNQENRFCGWFDAELSEKGKEEAKHGAQAIKEAGYEFDCFYTSVLKRAIRTLWYIMDGCDQMWVPVIRTWRLNERHYGGLTGLNKAETAAKHGEEQVKIWRRSYDIPPPPMDEGHPFYKVISKERRYAGLKPGELPACESLKDTIARALPFWNDEIAPKIKQGNRVLIAAHGNSLRGIVKHLEGMSDAAIMELNLPTGIPIVYELDDNLKPTKPMQFLGDEETVRKAMEAVAAQGKVKK